MTQQLTTLLACLPSRSWCRRLLITLIVGLIGGHVHGGDLVVGLFPTNQIYTIIAGSTQTYDNVYVANAGTLNVLGTLNVTSNKCNIGNDGALIVRGTLNLDVTMLIASNGSVVFDGGIVHLSGDYTYLAVCQNARLIFTNNAFLHYVQYYYAQHGIYACDNAAVEFHDSRISCNGAAESIQLFNNASYLGVNTSAPDWKTWYMHDHTTLTLDRFVRGGDIVFDGSPNMTFRDSDTLMPWMYFGPGATVSTAFPTTNAVVTTMINSATPGFSGFPWSISYVNCTNVMWGINPDVGSSVTVSNSFLVMLLYQFSGPGTGTLSGIMRSGTIYTNMSLPVTDRTLSLINSYVHWWKVDIVKGYNLTADQLVFSEMMVKSNSVGVLSNCVCQGQTIHLGTQDSCFLDFRNGQVWTHVDSWNNSTLVLRDSLVDYRLQPIQYQTVNFAHNSSRMYWLNTTYGYNAIPAESQPAARDSALVTYLKLDTPATLPLNQSLDVMGDCWISAGPSCPDTFNDYQLLFAPQGSTNWTMVAQGTSPTTPNVSRLLGRWNTVGLPPGPYVLRLKLTVDGDTTAYPPDQFPAERVINLTSNRLVVSSPYGPSSPAVGVHGYIPGTSLLCSVSSPVLDGGTQYVAAGGVVVGNDFTLLNLTNLALTLTNDATLAWNWTTNYWLQLASLSPNGSVCPVSDWFVCATQVTLVALATNYYHFYAWRGDTNGCGSVGNTLTAVMTQARAIAADFAANVVTNGGAGTATPEWWLASFYGATNFGAVNDADTDRDGLKAWQEFIAGTDPTNAISTLRILSISNQPPVCEISFQSQTNRLYGLQTTTNLLGAWTNLFVVTNHDQSAALQLTFTNPCTPSFYRISAQPQ